MVSEYMYLKTAYASMVWMYASKLELQTSPKQFVKIYLNMFFEILLKSWNYFGLNHDCSLNMYRTVL